MSVHSESLGVTLNGNILTRHNVPGEHLHVLAAIYGQITVIYSEDGRIDVSAPMNEADHRTFAGLIHRQSSENKLSKKVDTKSGKPDNDPTPPTGGTPGAARRTFYDHIKAIAA